MDSGQESYLEVLRDNLEYLCRNAQTLAESEDPDAFGKSWLIVILTHQYGQVLIEYLERRLVQVAEEIEGITCAIPVLREVMKKGQMMFGGSVAHFTIFEGAISLETDILEGRFEKWEELRDELEFWEQD
jgi:hypothetical protein